MDKVITPGFDFYDLKYSGCALVKVADVPALLDGITINDNGKVTSDKLVCLPGGNKTPIYGPYRLDRVFARGRGVISFVAFNENSSGNKKDFTKKELEEQNAALVVSKQLAERDSAEKLAANEKRMAELEAAIANLSKRNR